MEMNDPSAEKMDILASGLLMEIHLSGCCFGEAERSLKRLKHRHCS